MASSADGTTIATGGAAAAKNDNHNLSAGSSTAAPPPPGTAIPEHRSNHPKNPQYPQQQQQDHIDSSSFAGFDLLNSALEWHMSTSSSADHNNNTTPTKTAIVAPTQQEPQSTTHSTPTGHEPHPAAPAFLARRPVSSQGVLVVGGGGGVLVLDQPQPQQPASTNHNNNHWDGSSNGTAPLWESQNKDTTTTTTTAPLGKDTMASVAASSLHAPAALSRTAIVGSSEDSTQIQQQQLEKELAPPPQQQRQEEEESPVPPEDLPPHALPLPPTHHQQQQPIPQDDDNPHPSLSKQQQQPRPPGKRPSPWREPRMDHQLPPPAREVQHYHHTTTTTSAVRDHKLISMQRRQARQQRRQYRKLTNDAVTVHIPLHITADLAVPLQRIRQKRIQALYAQFPALQQHPSQSTALESHNDNAVGASRGPLDRKLAGDDLTQEDDPAMKTAPSGRRPKKKKPVLKHVPQPHEYSNVIDYLEAKYVQGIMVGVGDDAIYQSDNNNNTDTSPHGGDNNDHDDEDDEGGGSVYSDTSFLDDSGLQRTVAEQVLGQTTTTKLELEHDSDGDDHAFFVNVGTLEVEENETTQHAYDPLQDTNNSKNKAVDKKPRKRKKQPPDGQPLEAGTKKQKTNGKAAASSKSAAKVESPKQKTKVQPVKNHTSVGSSSNSKPAAPSSAPASPEKKRPAKKVKDAAILKLQKIAETRKTKADALYAQVVELINQTTDEELPHKPKPETTRVTITVPPDRKPGDSITFVNPHHANQKLKCKIPHNIKANGTFKVSVPKPAEEFDPDKDYNRLGRTFYDALEHYARLYDEWCEAEGDYRKVAPPLNDDNDDDDEEFNPHQVKRQKFDQLAHEFPNDRLKTPVDKVYLQKILRRARQNKHKRELNLARQQQQQPPPSSAGEDDDDDGSSDDEEDDNNNESDAAEPSRKKVKVESGGSLSTGSSKRRLPRKVAVVPNLLLDFMTKTFDPRDFNPDF